MALVESLWRYPVKSMQGEQLDACVVSEKGVLGDRVYALIDQTDGKVVSAKNPRKWPNLLHYRARFLDEPHRERCEAPPVEITLPCGGTLTSDQSSANHILSESLGRPVSLECVPPSVPTLENQQATLDGFGEIVVEEMPLGTFFDAGPILILTTAMLTHLKSFHVGLESDVRRFRPNIVLRLGDCEDFDELGLLNTILHIDPDVRLRVTTPCPRCLMTSLSQPGLSADSSVLRFIATHRGGNMGVYALSENTATVFRRASIVVNHADKSD